MKKTTLFAAVACAALLSFHTDALDLTLKNAQSSTRQRTGLRWSRPHRMGYRLCGVSGSPSFQISL